MISSDDNNRVPKTSVICSPSDNFYCCGKEDGTVVMYGIFKGKKVHQIAKHALSASIIKLARSAPEKYLASGDDSGRIMVKILEPQSSGKDEWAVFKLIDKCINESIKQSLSNIQDRPLLIAGRTTAYIMNLKTKLELCCVHHPDQQEGLWINHTISPTLLVKVDAVQARQCLWQSLLPKNGSISSSSQDIHVADSLGKVQRAIQVRDRWLVVEILTTGPHYADS